MRTPAEFEEELDQYFFGRRSRSRRSAHFVLHVALNGSVSRLIPNFSMMPATAAMRIPTAYIFGHD